MKTDKHAIVVDLNNFSTFPTLAIGIIVSTLRNFGWKVSVLCPLIFGATSQVREFPETHKDHLMRRIHLSDFPFFRPIRDFLRSIYYSTVRRPQEVSLQQFEKMLGSNPDIVLVSAYFQHYSTVCRIAALCKSKATPLLLGGPAFNLGNAAEEWAKIPGVSAVFGGEADFNINELADAVISGLNAETFQGLTTAKFTSPPGAPARIKSSVPIPDYSDFPWHLYPVRVVPIMATRGCQWAKCRFCSDILTATGRRYRSRQLNGVLEEMKVQSERHSTNNFIFLDLKLNSDVDLFRGIIERIPEVLPDAQWLGTVHVDNRPDNGLSRRDLEAAVKSGMRRISFGLESGSQRLLDLMEKGSDVNVMERFLHDAHASGLSIRCTMFKGYPGENEDDLKKTFEFLSRNRAYIDRIRFNDFSILEGTKIWADIAFSNDDSELVTIGRNELEARLRYARKHNVSNAYRRAKAEVLKQVFEINRRPLRSGAEHFDGLM